MKKLTTWHAGEKAIQETVGLAGRMEMIGDRVIRDYLPDQHRDFFSQLPFVVLGSTDPQGDAWATVLAGRPGFISSPTRLDLDISVRADPSDPAGAGMQEGDAVGLLGIELHTRRRNRANGILHASASGGLRFEVDQSFGNCPQYIQLRDYEFVREPGAPSTGVAVESADIDLPARQIIEAADTFFVATYADRDVRRQVDVSHRGGRTGFVRVADDGTLTIPDFRGTFFFSTLGNLLLNGKAGLVFVDFETGDVLQMTGDAEVILDSPDMATFEGAERLWTFRARRVVRRPGALPLRWSFRKNGWSPQSLMTGTWGQARSEA
jgi:predicted pyridoxine 5'-phosphate oxidase superfamily flavin-nucleotide-binding protein